MDIPVIDALLASDAKGSSHFVKSDAANQRMIRFLHEAIENLTQAVAEQKIYNAEYRDNYSSISRAVEEAFNIQSHQNIDNVRAARESWGETDPRMYLWYHPAFANVGGALKKLQKFEGKDAAVDQFMPVLREAVALLELCKQLKPFIVKGRKPNQNKTEAQIALELANTGICPICAARQKLDDNQKMVMHGYQMSDYNHAGYRVGKCFGVGYAPYELSNEGNVAYAPVLKGHRKTIKVALSTAKSGQVTSIDIPASKRENGRTVNYTQTLTLEADPVEFRYAMDNHIRHLEYELDDVEEDIKINQDKIVSWTLQPLKYGGKQ